MEFACTVLSKAASPGCLIAAAPEEGYRSAAGLHL
jgi:hypothetical protein